MVSQISPSQIGRGNISLLILIRVSESPICVSKPDLVYSRFKEIKGTKTLSKYYDLIELTPYYVVYGVSIQIFLDCLH